MNSQPYLALQKRHQKELSDFPIAYAFNGSQLKEALEKLGATKYEVTTLGYGTVLRKTDVPAFEELMENHRRELYMAMRNKEFAEAAFLYEMDNHEYAINWSGDEDVLECFNLTEEMLKEMDLEDVYARARNAHFKHAQEWGMI
jgi:hypothetical protein